MIISEIPCMILSMGIPKLNFTAISPLAEVGTGKIHPLLYRCIVGMGRYVFYIRLKLVTYIREMQTLFNFLLDFWCGLFFSVFHSCFDSLYIVSIYAADAVATLY